MSESRIDELNRKRFELLRGLYDTSEGHRDPIINLFELAEELGLSRDEAYPLADWLKGEYLLEFQTVGGGISITHEGIKQVEKALASPDQPSDYFPPINLIYVGTMTQSQIQQGSVSSIQQQQLSSIDPEDLHELISEIRTHISELDLEEDQALELEAELTTLDAQARSPKPKLGIISEALASIRTILESAAGQAIASVLLELLMRLQ